MTLNQLCEKVIHECPFTDDTRRDYRGYHERTIRNTIGHVDVTALTDTHIKDWLRQVITQQPASQVMPTARFMRKLLNEAVKRRHLKTHFLQYGALKSKLKEFGFSRPTRSGTRTYFRAPVQAAGGGTVAFQVLATDWAAHSTPDKLLRNERTEIMTTVWIPALGNTPLASLTRLDILRVTIPMQNSGQLKEAYRAISILRLFFRDMVIAGRITANPARMPTMCFNIVHDANLDKKQNTNSKQRLFSMFR